MSKQASLPDYVKPNPKVRPQDDFYTYVCSNWLKENPRPADKPRWGQFDQLRRKATKQTQSLIADWQKSKDLDPAEQQALDLYRVLKNVDQYKAQNLKTFKKLLGLADRLNEKNQAQLIGRLTRAKVDFFWSPCVYVDRKNSQGYALYLGQSGLVLPNREYYLSDNPSLVEIRKKYKEFIGGFSQKLAKAGCNLSIDPKQILALETKLAELAWSVERSRDGIATYNPCPKHRLSKKFPFDWSGYWEELGCKVPNKVIIEQPDYFKETTKLLKDLPISELKSYLKWQIAWTFSGSLSQAFSKAKLDFTQKTVLGQKKITPFNERVANNVSNSLVDTVGKAYVAKYFSDEQNQALLSLAQDVCDAFSERLAKTKWLKPKSRRYAQKKLSKIIVNLGQPKTWKTYSDFEVFSKDAVGTALSWAQFSTKKSFELLRKKPERANFSEYGPWGAQTINAWTNTVLLNTNYPAAILQPPFYDVQASLAYNLGALGSTIGHELTHNFDDMGSNFDHRGQLRPWLTKKEQKAFGEAAKNLADLADQFEVAPKVKMVGGQVIGEAIADLGGLEIVLDVVKKHYKGKAQTGAIKTLLISYAYHWANSASSSWRIMAAKSDPHPDPVYRVNGILPHCQEFYKAYKLKKTDKLYLPPSKRAKIW